MPGTVKKLQFSEGTDVGAPTDLSLQTSTSVIKAYADDSAYVTGEGAAVAGSVYINTTTKTLRLYANGAWRNAWVETDASDATKLIVKDLSGQTTGTTLTLASIITANRTITFPDVSMTVAGRANTETLSNKTLASPLISGGSVDVASAGALAVGASVGANNLTLGGSSSTVVVAGDLTVQGTTTTINTANLDVEDKNITVNDGGNDASSEGAGLTVERTGTNGSIIYAAAAASKFKVGPAGSEVEIADISSSQVFTNKRMHLHTTAAANDSTSPRVVLPQNTLTNLQAISGANHPNEGALYWATDLNKPYVWDGSLLKELGSGGGGGSKNYLTAITTSNGVNTGNGDIELGSTTGFSLGNVALTSNFPSGSPTFGSGASGNLSISAVNSNQLSGTYSLSYASSAATTAGNFVATDAFYVDKEDYGKMLQIKFSYIAQSNPSNGNFSGTSSNSFGIAIYDVTNSAWIQPAGVWNLVQSSGAGVATATFQTTAASTQYRLVIFNANASAGAITMYFDSFSVGPQSFVQGPAMTDWISYTPTFSGLGTTSNVSGWYRRIGDSIEIRAYALAGTASGQASFTLPSGLTLNTAAMPPSTRGNLGTVHRIDTGGNQVLLAAAYYSSSLGASSIALNGRSDTGQYEYGTQGFSSNQGVGVHCFAPISGWSSNLSLSQDTDTRVVAARYHYSGAGQTITSGSYTALAMTIQDYDTHAAYNTSTGVYTVPVAGKYKAAANIEFTAFAVADSTVAVALFKNGTQQSEFKVLTSATNNTWCTWGTDYADCKAGDTLEMRGFQNSGSNRTAGFNPTFNFVSFERVSGPAVIAATEIVLAKATGTPTGGTGAASIIVFPTSAKDTHAAYNTTTGRFTCPVSGDYRITSYLGGSNATIGITAYKNAVSDTIIGFTQTSTSAGIFNGSTVITGCLAGDILDIRTSAAIGAFGSGASIIFERVK